eukprot:s802_g8.t1
MVVIFGPFLYSVQLVWRNGELIENLFEGPQNHFRNKKNRWCLHGDAGAMASLSDMAEVSPMIGKLEEEVIALLLARDDVKSSIELAEEGQMEEATASLLSIIHDLLAPTKPSTAAPAAPAASAAAAAASKRPAESVAAEEAKRHRQEESWLEDCSRSAETERVSAAVDTAARLRGRRAVLTAAAAVEVVEVVDADAVPLFWRVDLPEVLKVLSQRGVLPSNFLPVVKPHVTLLYLGGDLPEHRAASRCNMTLQQFRSAKQALEKLQGKQVAVKMTEIIIEENVACALVELPKGVPCASKIPHLTLGTRENVPARHANDILEEIVSQGRTEGITRIKLPKAKELRGILDLETSDSYAGRK